MKQLKTMMSPTDDAEQARWQYLKIQNNIVSKSVLN